MFRQTLAATVLVVSASTASAVDVGAAMQAFLDTNVRAWAQEPALIDAIVAQNAETAGFDAARIDELDQAWRAEVGGDTTPTIDAVVNTPASDFLRARVAEAGGVVTEIFVMDQVGLNVASSGITSDYWQGDEEKFSQTFGVGPDAIHISEIEFDESSQTYQAQISIPLTDPSTGALVGAMTVGVNAESLL